MTNQQSQDSLLAIIVSGRETDEFAQSAFRGREGNPFRSELHTEEIRAGLLVDVTDAAQKAGFAGGVAVTKNLWGNIVGASEGQADTGVNAEMARVMDAAWRCVSRPEATASELFFEVALSAVTGKPRPKLVRLVREKSDAEEPAITLSNPDTDPYFSLGRTVLTLGAIAAFLGDSVSPASLLARHRHGDWGEVDKFDWGRNDYAVYSDERILSAYTLPATQKQVWIITEADRSVTTVLLPSEY